MYDNSPTHKKPKGNTPLYILTAVSVLVISIVLGLAVWSCVYILGFREFIGDLSRSTSFAYNYNCLVAASDEGTVPILQDNVYPIYSRIASAGAGRLASPPDEEPEAVLNFGDGSYLELWTVKLKNPSRDREYGLFISYVNKDGERYSYDTDKLEISLLPIDSGRNQEEKATPNKIPGG